MKKSEIKIARGHWQEEIFYYLTKGDVVPSPQRMLRGRAKNYMGKYEDSFHSLLSRMRQAGYRIERTPGPRGGEWGATYKLA